MGRKNRGQGLDKYEFYEYFEKKGKAKPTARWGRKATDLRIEIAGLPRKGQSGFLFLKSSGGMFSVKK
jgi:hypothetical protein